MTFSDTSPTALILSAGHEVRDGQRPPFEAEDILQENCAIWTLDGISEDIGQQGASALTTARLVSAHLVDIRGLMARYVIE
jgi:hypothetical protein